MPVKPARRAPKARIVSPPFRLRSASRSRSGQARGVQPRQAHQASGPCRSARAEPTAGAAPARGTAITRPSSSTTAIASSLRPRAPCPCGLACRQQIGPCTDRSEQDRQHVAALASTSTPSDRSNQSLPLPAPPRSFADFAGRNRKLSSSPLASLRRSCGTRRQTKSGQAVDSRSAIDVFVLFRVVVRHGKGTKPARASAS